MVDTRHSDKIVALENPLTFTLGGHKVKKYNEILYVGRLEYSPKRVDRVLKIWKIVSRNNPDWHLNIIGDGNDRERLEDLSRKWGLEHVAFTGRTDPQPYYERAKILLLTSNHEGTPMVIQEAMSYGVVPVVMDSFSSAADMITNGYDGLLTKAYSITDMAHKVDRLISNQQFLQKLSLNARSTIFSINNDEVLSKWDELLHL